MSAAPPKPFYLIPPTHFSPAFQTNNGDGVLGNGNFTGVFWVVGSVMTLLYQLIWGGTTAGTGLILLPLPPDWTAANVDSPSMLQQGPFSLAPSDHYEQSLAGVVTAPGGAGVLTGGGLQILNPAIPAGIAGNDFMIWKVQIPIVDNLPR